MSVQSATAHESRDTNRAAAWPLAHAYAEAVVALDRLQAAIAEHCGEDDGYAKAAALNTRHINAQAKQHLRRLGWNEAAND